MIRNKKSPQIKLYLGIIGLLVTGIMVINLNPDIWWKELIVIMTAFCSMLLIFIQGFKSTKWSFLTDLVIFSLLLLNRLGILDILTGALLIIIFGLISLIN
jgi:hypothetical protein